MEYMDSRARAPEREDYIEAETVSNDDGSEKSSLLEFQDFKLKDNYITEELFKLKCLVQKMENSFFMANTIDNSLLLKCVLLEAENQNLKRNICEKNIKLNHILCKNSLTIKEKKREPNNGQRQVRRVFSCVTNAVKQTETDKSEVKKLEDMITYLEEQLKDREKTVELLCEKYLYLKSNKNRMELDLKKKICRLERLLNATYGILQDVQSNVESKIEKYISKTKNMYEVLFLQEKWRCNKLMYENVRLHHEIKTLEESGKKRKKLFIQNGGKYYEVTKHNVDKCMSEPKM